MQWTMKSLLGQDWDPLYQLTIWNTINREPLLGQDVGLPAIPAPEVERGRVRGREALQLGRVAHLGSNQLVADPKGRRNCQ